MVSDAHQYSCEETRDSVPSSRQVKKSNAMLMPSPVG